MLNYKLVVERTLAQPYHIASGCDRHPGALRRTRRHRHIQPQRHTARAAGKRYCSGRYKLLSQRGRLRAPARESGIDVLRRTGRRGRQRHLCPVSAHGVCHSSAVYGICGGRDGGRQRDIRHVYRPTLAHRIVCRNRKNGFGIFSELTKGGNNEKQMENSRHCNAWRGDYRILCLVVVTPGQ